MAVAAAIGVGDGGDQEEGDVMSSRLANATSRLSGKRSLLRSSSGIPSSNSESLGQSQQQRRVQLQQQQGLSEINRSIEKMTLQTMNNGESSSSHRWDHWVYEWGMFECQKLIIKVDKILKGSLDLFPSPLVKI